jgi:hypothetical protein
MVVITSATYGDEFSSTDVLGALRTRLAKGGQVLVDSSLIPIVSRVTGPTSLSDAEKEDAKAKAVQACGGTNDQTCIEMKTQEFARMRLDEKEKEQNTPASIVKGRRATIKFVGSDGRERTAVIPEGQPIDLEPKPAQAFDMASVKGFDWGSVGGTAAKTVLGILGTMAYVGSVLLTWKEFPRYGMYTLTWIMTGIAVLIPYSGFALSLGSMFFSAYSSRKATYLKLIDAQRISG